MRCLGATLQLIATSRSSHQRSGSFTPECSCVGHFGSSPTKRLRYLFLPRVGVKQREASSAFRSRCQANLIQTALSLLLALVITAINTVLQNQHVVFQTCNYNPQDGSPSKLSRVVGSIRKSCRSRCRRRNWAASFTTPKAFARSG